MLNPDPARLIVDLDEALVHSRTVIICRPRDGSEAIATVKALIRGFKPNELVGGITQDDMKIILSPTGLSSWSEGYPKKGDWVEIGGKMKSIQASGPFYVSDVLVRIELLVRG